MRKVLLLTIVALSMLFTQCKKSEVLQPVQPEMINITLNVGDGSKVDVNTGNGKVNFESGDVIYVAYNGMYLGSVTNDGSKFTGSIIKPSEEGHYFDFYFLGGKPVKDQGGNNPSATSTTLTVNISDQSGSLPIISYGQSNITYSESTKSYSTKLYNKCALVKFSPTSDKGTILGCVGIKGMNNQLTVTLTGNSFAYSKDGAGVIRLNKNDQGYWAILFPQTEVTGSTDGDAYSTDGFYGTFGKIEAVTENAYMNTGVQIILNKVREFSVSGETKIRFSSGNVQCKPISLNNYEWRFAPNQWDICADGSITDLSDYYKEDSNTWIDLFGWGTTGEKDTETASDNNQKYYQPYATANNTSNNYDDENYGPTYSVKPCNLAVAKHSDWGFRFNTYEENTNNSGWRTPNQAEWIYLLNRSGKYMRTTLTLSDGETVYGLIVMPDDFNGSLSGTTSWSVWMNLESEGAVFLPAAGYREGKELKLFQTDGYYWSSSYGIENPEYKACYPHFNSGLWKIDDCGRRHYGFPVRLVREIPVPTK